MNDWFEIFRAGRHTDSQGRVRDWTTQDLDHAIKSYDPASHEAPLVIGHPATNGPAYGWVEKLKRVGDVLMAKPRQVVEEFATLVKDGRFKKRSVSFYPDGTLRHVGFLGAAAPAVKGLKDIAFDADEYFHQYEEEPVSGSGDGDPQPTNDPEAEMDPKEKEALEKKLADEKAAREEAEAKFNEEKSRADKLQGEKDAQASSFAEKRRKEQDASRRERIKTLTDAGKMLPAESGKILRFAAAIGSSTGPYEYCEAGASFVSERMEKLGLSAEDVAARMQGDGARDAATVTKIASNHSERPPDVVLKSLAPALDSTFEELQKAFGEEVSADTPEKLEAEFWAFIEARGTHGLFRKMEVKEGDEEELDHSEEDAAASLILGDRPSVKDTATEAATG